MRYYKRFPPEYTEKLVVLKSAELPVYYGDDVPVAEGVYERVRFKTYQFVFEPLRRRYRDPYMVHEEYFAFRVKIEIPPPPEQEIPPKERELLKKLRDLAEHSTATPGERKSAFEKMRRIRARLDDAVEYEVDDEFLSIDRTELFLDNVETLCGGDCGLAMTGFPMERRYDLFVCGQKWESAEMIVQWAQGAADWYLRVPALLSGGQCERPLSESYFEKGV